MACTRRSLTSSFTHISRCFRPSFAHVIRDDRDGGQPPCRPPSPPVLLPPPAPTFSRSIPAFGVPLRDGRRLGLPHLMGLDPIPRRYFSSSDGGSSEIGYLKDVSEVLTDTTIEAAVAASTVPAPFPGEVAAAAADSFPPIAVLQYLIDGVHSVTGLNWWVAIALTTLLIRGAMIPLLLHQMKASLKLSMLKPELEEVTKQMKNSMDPESVRESQRRMSELFTKHGVSPLTPLKGLFIQGPVFISFFMAISNMVEKVPSFKGGGALWFTDLTTPDPMYMLPVLTSLTFLATVELNMQEGIEGNPMATHMKTFSRVLALMTIPFTAHFPKAIFCYWITSNIFSLMYGFALKRPPVRKFLNLPDIVAQPSKPAVPSFPFFGGSKLFAPTAPPSPAKESEEVKFSGRRVASSSAISQRIRSLEKTVKARSKTKKR